MKKINRYLSFCVTAIFLYTLTSCAGSTALSSQLHVHQSTTTAYEMEIAALLSIPEDKIDIGTAALTLEKEIYPELDVDVYSALLDHTVGRAKTMTGGSADPDYRIRVLNTLLYKIIGIRYDFKDPYGDINLNVRLLKGVLDSRKGNCVSMALLYLAISQRLGYPVYAVRAPDHIFCDI